MNLVKATFLAILLVLGGWLILGSRAPAGGESALRPLQDAPKLDISLQDSQGKIVALADEKAPILILHFFATSCDACREELPALANLARQNGEELAVYAISVAEPDARIRRFLQKMPLSLPVLLDRDRQTAKAWKVASLPTTFILDQNRQARVFTEESFRWDRLNARSLKRLLNQSEKQKNAFANPAMADRGSSNAIETP